MPPFTVEQCFQVFETYNRTIWPLQLVVYGYRALRDAQTRLAAGYMIFYSIGCAVGSMLSTMTYAQFGWNGACLLGASGSAAGLAFWTATRGRCDF